MAGTDPSTSDLVRDLSEQTATLVRKEIALLQVEMKEKGKRVGIGGGLFGTAGLLALYGLGALVATAILGLATAVDAWLAALIVAVAIFVIAGIAALIGRSQVEKATPPAPERTIESVREDVDTIKESASR